MKVIQNLDVGGSGTFAGNVSVPNGTAPAHVVNKLQMDSAIALNPGGITIGATATGATAGQVPFFGAGPVAAVDAGLTYASGALTVGSAGSGLVLIGQAGTSIGGAGQVMEFRSGGVQALSLQQGTPIIFGPHADGGEIMLKGRNADGNLNRLGSVLAIAPGETTGNSPGIGVRFYYSPTGVSGTSVNALVLGASLSGTGVFYANDLATPMLRLTPEPVGTLPTPTAGRIKFANDLTVTTKDTVATGGGSNKRMVQADGTNWLIV